jgi:hypothetical protein
MRKRARVWIACAVGALLGACAGTGADGPDRLASSVTACQREASRSELGGSGSWTISADDQAVPSEFVLQVDGAKVCSALAALGGRRLIALSDLELQRLVGGQFEMGQAVAAFEARIDSKIEDVRSWPLRHGTASSIVEAVIARESTTRARYSRGTRIGSMKAFLIRSVSPRGQNGSIAVLYRNSDVTVTYSLLSPDVGELEAKPIIAFFDFEPREIYFTLSTFP